MGRARSKVAPRLTVVDEAPDATPTDTLNRAADELGVERDRLIALQKTFAPTLDFDRPCSYPIPRPRRLEGRLVQHGRSGSLWCNRPGGHTGPHRVYSDDFAILAEVLL